MPSMIDSLEQRILFAARAPSVEETYLVELINRARNSPLLEAQRYGIDLNEGLNPGQITTAAKQPLAINAFLTDSSNLHAIWMRQNQQISYVGNGGSVPRERMDTAGYVFQGTNGEAENIGSIVGDDVPVTQAIVDQIHRNLFVDNGINNRPNRVNMLSTSFKEVGPGLDWGNWGTGGGGGGGGGGQEAVTVVEDFALSTGNTVGDNFLVGVAYNDANTNGFYDIGEGMGGVNVSARRLSDNATFTTTVYGSGAYSLRVPDGTYDVIATGGNLGGAVRFSAVVVNGRNVKRDFTPQNSGTIPPDPGGGQTPTVPNPVTLTADLKGRLYVDQNGDGNKDKDVDASTIQGVKVYLDIDKDNVRDANEPFGVVINDKGVWNIVGVAPGIYQVKVETPDGYRVSVPEKAFREVKAVSGKLKNIQPFLITPRTIISGYVYQDNNNNGQKDKGIDRDRDGWRVYIDLNNDGVWQKGIEPARLSEQNGYYAFRDLLPSTYVVRIIPKVGYVQTEPANNGFYIVQIPAEGFSVINRNFGQRLLTGSSAMRIRS